MDLRHRIAIVTGGGSGLGSVLCAELASAGATVLVADRDADLAQGTAQTLAEAGSPAVPCEVDVTDDEQCRDLIALAIDLGGPHVLVNNAGGWTAGPHQFPDADPAAWSASLDLNLRAPMLLTQLSRPAMLSCGGGVVVCVSSSAALGDDGYESPEYAAAKAGLIRFTTAMGSGAGQRVVCVVPGWMGLPRARAQWRLLPDEHRTRLAPLVPPEDVAGAGP